MVDFSSPKNVHILAVGGAGMSGIATLLVTDGHRVTGSDQTASPVTDRLKKLGVKVSIGHDRKNIAAGTDAVIVSTAIHSDNVELLAARNAALPIVSRAKALAAIASQKETVAISGTHGKTTTTAMTTLLMRAAGFDPSYLIGGDVPELGGGSGAGNGNWLVVEADESDGTFIQIPRVGSLTTNIEIDHMDHFGSFENLEAAFKQFVDETDGPALVGTDNENSSRLVGRGAISYGSADGSTYQMADFVPDGFESSFEILQRGTSIGRFKLCVPGIHNAQNATGAIALALELGAGLEGLRNALNSFGGVARRFQRRGELNGAAIFDDYAHLPAEIKATVAAARQLHPKRVVCVFQPHRYSRTKTIAADFGRAFSDVDEILITDVYPAGEDPIPGIDGTRISETVQKNEPNKTVRYFPCVEEGALTERHPDLASQVAGLLSPGDIVLTLGAGDITNLADALLDLATTR